MFKRLGIILGTLLKLRALRRHDLWTREKLLVYQAVRLADIRAFALKNSPFYRKFHQGFENAPFEKLPVLTKRMVMDNFEELVTDPALKLAEIRKHIEQPDYGRFGKYEIAATSGSTGAPGIFLFNPDEWQWMIASYGRAREWSGMKIRITKRSRMAVVSSTNARNVSARVGKAADTPFLPTLRIDATEPMEKIVAALNAWQPETLVAYASMAYFLAQEQQAGRLAIYPRKVFTSSEVLTRQMRETIEAVWGNCVFNEYTSTETATIAAEDEQHHGLHIFEDMLVVENVDEKNQPVPDGVYGDKILITSLFSRTQPLIRYEISDSVRFKPGVGHQDLPYRLIDTLQGRSEDFLSIGGKEIHPNVFHDVMDGIRTQGWQIVQEPERLRILTLGLADAPDLAQRIHDALSANGVPVNTIPQVAVEHVQAIPKAKSGKSPLIQALKRANKV